MSRTEEPENIFCGQITWKIHQRWGDGDVTTWNANETAIARWADGDQAQIRRWADADFPWCESPMERTMKSSKRCKVITLWKFGRIPMFCGCHWGRCNAWRGLRCSCIVPEKSVSTWHRLSIASAIRPNRVHTDPLHNGGKIQSWNKFLSVRTVGNCH